MSLLRKFNSSKSVNVKSSVFSFLSNSFQALNYMKFLVDISSLSIIEYYGFYGKFSFCFRSKLRSIRKIEKRVRVTIRHFLKGKIFYWGVLILVFLNTITMALYKHDQQEEIATVLGM